MSSLGRKIRRQKERETVCVQIKAARKKAKRIGKTPMHNRKERRDFKFKRGEWANWED